MKYSWRRWSSGRCLVRSCIGEDWMSRMGSGILHLRDHLIILTINNHNNNNKNNNNNNKIYKNKYNNKNNNNTYNNHLPLKNLRTNLTPPPTYKNNNNYNNELSLLNITPNLTHYRRDLILPVSTTFLINSSPKPNHVPN